jgi:cathepsin L
MELESTYPYKGVDQRCQYDSTKATSYHTTGYTPISANNASAMKNALSGRPINVAIEADTFYFQHYTDGILDNASKCGNNLDHAVAVVGWGTENGREYWIVRNSWSAGWGESGYVRLLITSGEGICGVQMDTLYPNIA